MSGFNAGGFPGAMPGAPNGMAMPGAPGVQQHAGGFVLDIPADPNWEPFEQDDVLEMDGYYAGRIKSERFVEGKNGKAGGVWIAVELLDDDVRGKSISKQLADPRASTKDVWFMWRGMFRSIYGLDGARAAQRYTLGAVTNAPVYIRTGIYISNDGAQRTGIDNWCTKEEYDKAVADKKHRWAPKPRNAGGAAGMTGPGALPSGLPPAFPGMGGPLPGAPSAPVGFPTAVPQPMAAAPMQSAPQQQAAPAPQQAAPPPAWGGGAPTGPTPPLAPTAAPVAAWNQGVQGFQPPPQPEQPAPQQGFAPAPGFAAPTGAVPPPVGGSAFPGFPGGPPPQYPPRQ